MLIIKNKNSMPTTCLIGPSAGLTLVELMIAVAISGFVISAIYMSFKAQQRTSFIQEEVVSTQQNGRAALSVMISELRMAGYDRSGNSGATITSANSTSIGFTMDLDEDGNASESGENIFYSLYSPNSIKSLGRKPHGSGSNNSAVAEYIDYLEFQYFDATDSELPTPVAIPGNIRRIQFSLLARSATNDPDYTNKNVYTTLGGINPKTGDANTTATYQDGYRRRLFFDTVTCRNMGI